MKLSTLFLSFALSISMALTALHALAETERKTVYKSIAPDGGVTFTDIPSENAQTITIEPVTIVPALTKQKQSTNKASKPNSPRTLYSQLEFISPIHDSAFHSAAGIVDIYLKLSPPLQKGHIVQLALDGKEVAQQSQLTLQLNNIDRGTHTLSASILSNTGEILKSTTSTFTVHRPAIKRISLPPAPQ